jgi:uncharacterized protein YjiS (DUF1127 family)
LACGLAAWRKHRRDRRLPAALDDRMLRDLGIEGRAASTDSASSFWQVHRPGPPPFV